jgi:hypothetical protein
MAEQRCEFCRFFQMTRDCRDSGECRRGAPEIRFSTDEEGRIRHHGYWPQVAVRDWCGEFAASNIVHVSAVPSRAG